MSRNYARLSTALVREYGELRPATEFLDDTLCMFGLAGWPLEDLLDQVAAFPDDVLARRFWNDWCMGHPSIWITAFWEGSGSTQAFNFYTSRTLFRRMEALAFAQTTDPELADWVPHTKGGAAEMQ